MPTYIEHFDTLNPEDHQDMVKIHTDAPEWLQTPAQAEQWITSALSTTGLHLYGARFNDRLLGAAIIDQSQEGLWQLKWLSVRTVTRDRGVGRRMVAELTRFANEQNCALKADKTEQTLPSYIQELM